MEYKLVARNDDSILRRYKLKRQYLGLVFEQSHENQHRSNPIIRNIQNIIINFDCMHHICSR